MESYEVEFLCPDGGSLMFEIKIDCELSKKDKKKEIIKKARNVLLSNYFSMLHNEFHYSDLCIYYNGGKDASRQELEKIVWKVDQPKYKCISISKVTSCEGCRNGILNQLGHMYKGGCLYDSELSE